MQKRNMFPVNILLFAVIGTYSIHLVFCLEATLCVCDENKITPSTWFILHASSISTVPSVLWGLDFQCLGNVLTTASTINFSLALRRQPLGKKKKKTTYNSCYSQKEKANHFTVPRVERLHIILESLCKC